jgi:hypothetical protein
LILPYDNSPIEVSEIIESANDIVKVKNQEKLNNIFTANNATLNIPQIEKKEIISKKNTHNLSDTKFTLEDEIEVKVIEIKYEKHFLEIILEKLDRLILWLEEILIKIVNKINILRKKP